MEFLTMLIICLLKSMKGILGCMNTELDDELARIINEFEASKRAIQEKVELSHQAMEKWKKDELEKLDKQREEIELRYAGEIIDVEAEKEFEDNLANQKANSEAQLQKMQDSLEALKEEFKAVCGVEQN